MVPPATHTQVEQNSGEEDRMDRLRNSSRSWDPAGISIYHSRSSLFLALMSVSQPPLLPPQANYTGGEDGSRKKASCQTNQRRTEMVSAGQRLLFFYTVVV